MEKQASVITVGKIGNGSFRVDARGAFGGGWTRSVDADKLKGAIIIAWQQYSNNPMGCEIIGEMPTEVQELADKLMASGEKDDSVITLRVPQYEAERIRAAAAADGRSVNQWVRLTISKSLEK